MPIQPISRHLTGLTELRDQPGSPAERLHSVLWAYGLITRERRSHEHPDGELATLSHRGIDVTGAPRQVHEIVEDLVAGAARGYTTRRDCRTLAQCRSPHTPSPPSSARDGAASTSGCCASCSTSAQATMLTALVGTLWARAEAAIRERRAAAPASKSMHVMNTIVELEITVVALPDYLLVIHVMPIQYRRKS